MSAPWHNLLQLLAALLGCLSANVGIPAGAQAAGQRLADGQLVGHVQQRQVLGVRVDGEVLHAGDPVAEHPVNGVAAAAAYSDYSDDGVAVRLALG